jgi:LysM repeat protein
MRKFKISNFDIGMPAVLAGAGILTLIICLIVLLPAKKPSNENRDLSDEVTRMENRIDELENQLNSSIASMETNEALPEVLSENDVQIQSLTEQMASIQKKIDYIDKRQGNLEQRVVALSTAATAKKADKPKRAMKSAPKKESASKQATKATVKKQAPAVKQTAAKSAKYHIVAGGETRYAIARRYGLTVAQLDRMNGFSAETIIHPGQKILIQK